MVVDGKGRIRSGYKGSVENPMLHLFSHSVSSDYLAFLQEHQIPYIITGNESVNLKEAMEKLKTKLGIIMLFHSSGGKLAGALLRENLIDEVNVIVQPRLVGGTNIPSLFEASDLKLDELPTNLLLLSSEVKQDGYLLLRYKVKR